MSYRDLEIWKLARETVITIHKMTLQLSKFEFFEEGARSGNHQKQPSPQSSRDMAGEDINRIGSNFWHKLIHLTMRRLII